MWLSWVDNCVVGGSGDHANQEKKIMMKLFDCNNSRDMREYIGTKVEVKKEKRLIRLTQPIIVQSFTDEFGM